MLNKELNINIDYLSIVFETLKADELIRRLLEIALDFERLSKILIEVSNKFQNEAKIMNQKNYYDGRNRENLDVANYAASNHINNLTEYYSMCYSYILNAYNKMVELDEELANAIITAYIGEHHVK